MPARYSLDDAVGKKFDAWLERWTGREEGQIDLKIQPVNIQDNGKESKELAKLIATICDTQITYGFCGGENDNLLELFPPEKSLDLYKRILETIKLIEARNAVAVDDENQDNGGKSIAA
jgi:hypothetical protein